MVSRKSEAQMSEEYLRLLSYVEQQPDGALLAYDEVEQHTGVKMTQSNKDKLRRAILRSGKEYTAIHTVGYQLAKPDNAMGILTHRLGRIDTQVRRADRAQQVIQKQFYDSLKPEEQQSVLYLGAIFGAIRTAAENGKKIYHRPRPQLNQSPMVIDIAL